MRLLAFLLCLSIALPAQAFKLESNNSPTDPFLLECKPTPQLITRKFKKHALDFNSSNNLLKPPGAYYPLKGEAVLIVGRVVDAKCTPLVNAKVEMFQPDPTGYYHDNKPNRLFPGAMFAVTDNLGFFTMVTVYPGGLKDNAPRMHFKISHNEYKMFQTTMYFDNEVRNATDKALLKVPEELRPLLLSTVTRGEIPEYGDALHATMHFTISGSHVFRKF